MNPTDIMIATTSFTTSYEGRRVIVRKGITRVHRGHPIVRGHAEAFRPIDVHFPVETAAVDAPAPSPPARTPEPTPAPTYPRHVGGGIYETADGERHRGRDAALAHMEPGES